MAIEGIPAMTVTRAIRDCAQWQLGPALVRQAIEDARTGGWITDSEQRDLHGHLLDARSL